RDPDGSFLHDPRRHQRDPPLGGGEGSALVTDPLLIETAGRLFSDTCTHRSIQAAEREGWAPGVWAPVAEVGLPWIAIPEAAGGGGGALPDALAVLRIAGRYAAPIPLAETGLLAGWLLAGAGLPVG